MVGPGFARNLPVGRGFYVFIALAAIGGLSFWGFVLYLAWKLVAHFTG